MMTQSLHHHPIRSRHRRGAAAVFILILMVPLVSLLGFIVNLSYIQSMRTQQKVAVDCCAQAAVEALVRTQSMLEAKQAAQRVAAKHTVGSETFSVPESGVIFGRSIEQTNGKFLFEEWRKPFNAVRIDSGMGTNEKGSADGVRLMFSGIGKDVYSNRESSTASFMINEVVLCLDRSGSMKWDMSGRSGVYPSGNPNVRSQSPYEHFYAAPHPTRSRWAITMGAVDTFLAEADKTEQPPRVGLVTWSSSHNRSGLASIDYLLPPPSASWQANRKGIETVLDRESGERAPNGVYGGTQMASGLLKGLDALQSKNSHAYANRVLIALTDGQYQGADPFSVVDRARKEGVTIHCISLLAGSTFSKAKQIASATGGGAYMATNKQQLEDAFRKIARSLDVVLTE